MVLFVSSTYRGLQHERAAVQSALQAGQAAPWGMEFFYSQPERPLNVCLNELRQCGAVILIVGFHGGSLVPDGTGLTYTQREIEEARMLGLPVFAFVKTENGSWRNEEPAGAVHEALEQVRRHVLESCGTVSVFENLDQLKFEVLASIQKWTDRGRPGARKTFASREEFFAPFEDVAAGPGLFDYRQTLVGRGMEIQSLNGFLSDPKLSIALLPGRCGIGKTKLLYDWSGSLNDLQVSFLRVEATWHPESDKECPAGDLLIVVDAAHRASHIFQLLSLVQTLLQNSQRRVKLLLSTRPSAIPSLRSALSRFFEPDRVIELAPLTQLRVEHVRALAAEQLGPEFAHVRDWLVGLSADTPLVTVVGARLVRRGQLQNAAISNEAEFRHAVFDRFIEEYQTALPNDGFPWRRLIDLMSALSPTRARSEGFLSAAEEFLRVPRYQINQALNQLEAHGLIVRQDDRLRVAPDTLADFLLEDACINSHGEPTGYADAVFRAFRSYDLPSLLSNLSELEWRLEQRAAPQRVLRGIWETIESEFQQADAARRWDLLHALEGTAVFQPNQTLRIVRKAMDTEVQPGILFGDWEQTQEDVLEKVPEILETLAYHEEHTEEAVRRLFKLTKQVRSTNQVHGGPAKTLLSLASYRPYKRIAFLARVAEIATALASEPEAFAGPVTPLDIADELLKREARHEEMNELVFSIGSVELNHDTIAPLRHVALAMIEESLYAVEPRRAARAVRSAESVLSSFTPIAGRALTENEREWQDAERLEVLDVIERRVRKKDAAVPLLRQIKNALRQFRPQHHSEAFNRRLCEVAAVVPDSDKLVSFDAFCTGDFDWHFDVDDLMERNGLARAAREAAVNRFCAAHRQIEGQIRALELMARDSERYGICIDDSAPLFIEILCRQGDFTTAFIRYVLNEPHPRLGFQIRMLLPHLRSADPSYYETIGLACARHLTGDVAWGAAHGVCIGPPLQNPLAADAAIISELAKHPDDNVRKLAVLGAGRLGRIEPFQTQAAEIISGVDIAGNYVLADAVCEAFSTFGMPVTALAREQIHRILTGFVPIHRFDEQNHDIFFSRVAVLAPDILFNFFFGRLKRYAETRGSAHRGFAHWGNTPPSSHFRESPIPDGVADQLRHVRDFIATESVPASWTAELFWAFGSGADAAETVLQEWGNSGDPEKIRYARYLASARPSGPAPAGPMPVSSETL